VQSKEKVLANYLHPLQKD